MTAAPNAVIVAAVELLQAERNELLDLLRTVISGVPDHATVAEVHIPADVLAEIRRHA